jgi:hypothetical protein
MYARVEMLINSVDIQRDLPTDWSFREVIFRGTRYFPDYVEEDSRWKFVKTEGIE